MQMFHEEEKKNVQTKKFQRKGIWGGQGSLACCSLWGRKESDTTEQLN